VIELDAAYRQHIGGFTLPPVLTSVVVEGLVVDAVGQPVSDVLVQFANNFNQVTATVSTDKAGRFRLTVYSGYSYVLRARLQDRQGTVLMTGSCTLGLLAASPDLVRVVVMPPSGPVPAQHWIFSKSPLRSSLVQKIAIKAVTGACDACLSVVETYRRVLLS
jgi:hypothetical protein